ncbi:unnamed protein product [Nezara viridula]|uniref:Peptidase S1 domain-containing protein n=1 Tax=Nezara viridula TaxID=85310 RepID=A0A9P0HKS6_NEZVI|nr:unnamed protein product [Nezara viridula]
MRPINNIKLTFSFILLSITFCSGFKGVDIKKSYCTCEWKNKHNEKGMGRIIGGDEADDGEYPFMAGLFEEADGLVESVQCGATILGSLQLLTAAHCVNPSSNYSVVIGVLGLFDPDLTNIRKVSKIDIHPDFDENTLAGDIALLTVDHPLDFSSRRIGPVCLGQKKRKIHSEFRIVGWGCLSNMSTPQYLQEVSVDEYDYDNCYSRGLIDKHDRKQFCTLSRNKGPCLGDSGGPVLLFDAEKETYTLEGIVSKGPEDCRTLPSVHIDIHHPEYIDWITERSIDQICWIKNLPDDRDWTSRRKNILEYVN